MLCVYVCVCVLLASFVMRRYSEMIPNKHQVQSVFEIVTFLVLAFGIALCHYYKLIARNKLLFITIV